MKFKRKEGENRAKQFEEKPLVPDEEFGSPEYDGMALMGEDEYKTFDDLRRRFLFLFLCPFLTFKRVQHSLI